MKLRDFQIIKRNLKNNKAAKIVKDVTLALNPQQMSYDALNEECRKLWSEIVIKRAGNKCQWEGCKGTKRLNAHHIWSARNYRLRYNTWNGVCLCYFHHIGGKNNYNGASAHQSSLFSYILLKNLYSHSKLVRLYELSQGKNIKPGKPELVQTYLKLRYFKSA